MERIPRKTLTEKMLLYLISSAILGTLLFLAVHFITGAVLKSYLVNSDYIYRAEEKTIQQLRDYVFSQNIAATDTEPLREWARDQKLRSFTISRKNLLLYDDAYSGSVPMIRTSANSLNYNWLYFHQVHFSDGPADVYVNAGYEEPLYLVANIASTLLGVIVTLACFSRFIYQQVRRIQIINTGINAMKENRWAENIRLEGDDELGSLAEGINRLHAELERQKERENEIREAQDNFLIELTHDLRTPLTALSTLLELVKQKELEDDGSRELLDAALKKVFEINHLSNQLFDLLFISTTKRFEQKELEPARTALEECFASFSVLIVSDGFLLETEDFDWPEGMVFAYEPYMERIFNNLFSNLHKYASRRVPVLMNVYEETGCLALSLENEILETEDSASGTGIGLKNVTAMMEQMGGSVSVATENTRYRIVLRFPLN